MKIKSIKISSQVAVHGFFGKMGGSSSGVYSSLNCSEFVGDDIVCVSKNLDIVKNDLMSSGLIVLNQIHSNLCVVVDYDTCCNMKADAMVTRVPGIAIGVLTADCAPILFIDDKRKVVGAAHAGWKGAVSGVIQSTIQEMIKLGSSPKMIKVAIGPCIMQESYEVDERFKQNFDTEGDWFCTGEESHKMYFDLPKYCFNRLVESGVDKMNIDIMGVDTYANHKNYFSYRFADKHTNGICGRNISAICLN